MKRVIATIFLLVYFLTTSGATIQLHYCMNKLVSWSVRSNEKAKCGKCSMGKKGHKGCCHDESRFIKLGKVHKVNFNYFDLSKLQLSIPHYNLGSAEEVFVFNPLTSHPTSNAPPIQTQVPIYLFDCVFRI